MENKKQRIMPTPSPLNSGARILIGIPTAESKNYCYPELRDKLRKLTYKPHDILFADNSPSGHNNKKMFIKDGFNAIYVKPKNKPIQLVLAETHEEIRQHFLRGKWTHLLHLESDIMPCSDLIERLLIHNKQIVSASYMINNGIDSALMCQQLEAHGDIRETANIKDGADLNMMDGKLHEVFACGLGASLIRRDVLEQIPFRWVSPAIVFPDSFFAYDCDNLGIKKYIDTGLLLDHKNSNWTKEFSRFEK